jgi:hypothetical protein
VSAGSDYHLLTDGKRLLLETSPQQVIDILKNSRQPMFTICLSDTVRQIRAELEPHSRKKKTVRSDSGARRLRARRIS